MRYNYELRWYEFNLTEMQSRKFFYGDRSEALQVVLRAF